jgi:hypothetical protein
MSQQAGRTCPVCGTSAPLEQRFCSNCGADLSLTGQASSPNPASQYGGNTPQTYPSAQPPAQTYPSAQPPVPSYAQAPYTQYQQPQQPQKSSPLAEAFGALGLLFLLRRYRPGYRPRRQNSGCCGCLVMLVILLIVVGIPGYLAYKNNPNLLHSLQNQTNTPGNASSSVPPTKQPPITTASINQTVAYAGVDTTIVSAQQSTTFLDDSSSATNGMIRINLKEANNGSQNASYFYSDVAHLVLPDKSSVNLTNGQQAYGPNSNIVRSNWLDFAVPTNIKINQLTLRLGGSQEAQINIPLTGNANLSAYQTKTIHPNTPISYDNLNWTLKSATKSLSINGKQAATGMCYIILTFNVDNSTTNNVAIGLTNDYMRLKLGSTTNSDTGNTTLPLYANANTTGNSGTVTFMMPSSGNAFTLEMLAVDGYSSAQVNTNFTL